MENAFAFGISVNALVYETKKSNFKPSTLSACMCAVDKPADFDKHARRLSQADYKQGQQQLLRYVLSYSLIFDSTKCLWTRTVMLFVL